MAEQLTTSAEALRLFFTDDIYLVRTEEIVASAAPVATAPPEPSVAADVSTAAHAVPVNSPAALAEVPVSAVVVPTMPDGANPALSAVESKTAAVAAVPASTVVVPTMPGVANPVLSADVTAFQPATVFKYLGKNQKKVLILVNDAENDVSSESGRELLRNLVKAMQLTANDFALLNYFNYTHVKFEELSKFFSSTLILGFGVSPAQLGLNDQPLHSVAAHGGIQLVFTGRLDLLAGDQDGKKKLWSSLKQFTF